MDKGPLVMRPRTQIRHHGSLVSEIELKRLAVPELHLCWINGSPEARSSTKVDNRSIL